MDKSFQPRLDVTKRQIMLDNWKRAVGAARQFKHFSELEDTAPE